MKFRNALAALAGLSILAPGAALAQQGWAFRCIDPENDSPYSDDYGTNVLENDLAGVTMGVSGTVTYGGTNGPCYGPGARTLDAAGRISFWSGQVGSVQSTMDNFLAYTYGAPIDAAGDYGFARIIKTANNSTAGSVLFGDGGLNGYFVGASRRYMVGSWSDADVNAELNVRLIGDAVRLRWRLTNLTEDVLPLGLLFANYTGMHTSGGETDSQTGSNAALTLRGGIGSDPKFTANGYLGIVNTPTGRPIKTERKFTSASARFPDWVDFAFGQTDYYGIRIENNPSERFQDASTADQIIIADHILPGNGSTAGQVFMFGNAARQTVFNDPTGLLEEADVAITEYAFLQRFPAVQVGAGASHDIVHYVRSTWSNSDYRDPYTTVVDAPKLIGTDPTGLNGLANNPMTVRIYVDNQFADLDKEVALGDVRVRMELGTGLSFAPGETDGKIIQTIAPNAIAATQFSLVADGRVIGDIPYTVIVEPNPGPKRTITGVIKVSATPRIAKPAGPSMVGFPFTFTDSSLNAILGLQAGIDYQAFRWEPQNQEYVPVATPVRGQGYWIILNTAIAQNLLGATVAEDAGTGGLLTTLRRGWNLISNPYNFPLKLADINFVVTGSTDGGVLGFNEAVSQGVISGGLAYYAVDASGVGTYEFISDSGATLEPLSAYWIFSESFDSITLSWPPVFTPGLPNSGRSEAKPFEQSDRQWRLQLSARSKDGLDSKNYVGVASDPKSVDRLDILKPPAVPGAPFSVSILENRKGENTRMAQAISPRSGKMSWKVQVKAEKAGEVTLTWPNVSSLPKNLRFRITDAASGTVRDLRTASGYTFNVTEPGTREFTVTAEVGGATRALIGSVNVGRAGRDINGPVSISYSLSNDASVSVRILSSTGKEIYTVSRGRADSAGENTVTWLLRDNANRAVAPGVYRAEIVAESASGERVRKFVPINVIR